MAHSNPNPFQAHEELEAKVSDLGTEVGPHRGALKSWIENRVGLLEEVTMKGHHFIAFGPNINLFPLSYFWVFQMNCLFVDLHELCFVRNLKFALVAFFLTSFDGGTVPSFFLLQTTWKHMSNDEQ